MKPARLIVCAAAVSSVAACVDPGMTTSSVDLNRQAPASDESACLAAVAAQANNSVMVISSETSEANNMVMVGVGPDRAPWKCLVKNGAVAEVTSMMNEGFL